MLARREVRANQPVGEIRLGTGPGMDAQIGFGLDGDDRGVRLRCRAGRIVDHDVDARMIDATGGDGLPGKCAGGIGHPVDPFFAPARGEGCAGVIEHDRRAARRNRFEARAVQRQPTCGRGVGRQPGPGPSFAQGQGRGRPGCGQQSHIALAVTAGKIFLPDVGSSTHYYAQYVSPGWARAMNRMTKIGLHIFYRTKKGGWS